MNAAEELVVDSARAQAESGDATALEASLLIVIDNQQAAIRRVRELCEASIRENDGTQRPDAVSPWGILRALDGTA